MRHYLSLITLQWHVEVKLPCGKIPRGGVGGGYRLAHGLRAAVAQTVRSHTVTVMLSISN